MINPVPQDQLTNRQKNICEYGGVFGVLLSLTCLIQHFIFAIPNKYSNPMIPAYLLCITAFLLLALLKRVALIFLIVSAALTIIIEWRLYSSFAFSLVVLLLFIYNIIILVVIYTEQIPQRLKAMEKAKASEDTYWSDKL
ncbi:MAG: hypothetical protein U0U70_15295 [Chitinophagaceae bacterium]